MPQSKRNKRIKNSCNHKYEILKLRRDNKCLTRKLKDQQSTLKLNKQSKKEFFDDSNKSILNDSSNEESKELTKLVNIKKRKRAVYDNNTESVDLHQQIKQYQDKILSLQSKVQRLEFREKDLNKGYIEMKEKYYSLFHEIKDCKEEIDHMITHGTILDESNDGTCFVDYDTGDFYSFDDNIPEINKRLLLRRRQKLDQYK